MRLYKKTNVLEEAKKRISYIFDEFDEIVINHSGGKDSCVIFDLVMKEAKKRNIKPCVFFIDQEAEWTFTIDLIKEVMYRKDIKPYWFQMPIRLSNATTYNDDYYLYCWKEGDEWIREKDPISIKENKYGTMSFHKLWSHILPKEFPDKKVALFSGVRTEESPIRFLGLTSSLTYKDITWGKKNLNTNENYITFHPIYDWSYTDVWKYIAENNLKYNKIYDYQYRHGERIQNMRVSNLHHETAIRSLFYIHEVEPELHEKLIKRLPGIHSAIKYKDNYEKLKLPYMFKNWKEYREHLLEKLIPDKDKPVFRHWFDKMDIEFDSNPKIDNIIKSQCNCIIANDRTAVKLKNLYKNYESSETIAHYHKRKKELECKN
jgi:predicted phosphoadenosine phosphosulfate sulfurtransferase